jgi:hypothetical protein
MTDSPNRDAATPAAKTLEQSYATRGLLTALMAQTLQSEATIKYRLAELEDEAQRLRVQLDQISPVVESFKQLIRTVDESIRRQYRGITGATATLAQPRGAARASRAAARGSKTLTRTSRPKVSRPEPQEGHEQETSE